MQPARSAWLAPAGTAASYISALAAGALAAEARTDLRACKHIVVGHETRRIQEDARGCATSDCPHFSVKYLPRRLNVVRPTGALARTNSSADSWLFSTVDDTSAAAADAVICSKPSVSSPATTGQTCRSAAERSTVTLLQLAGSAAGITG